jgi:HK97 family phage major capsid protein
MKTNFKLQALSALILGGFLALSIGTGATKAGFSEITANIAALSIFLLSAVMPFVTLSSGILCTGGAGAGTRTPEDEMIEKIKSQVADLVKKASKETAEDLEEEIKKLKARLKELEEEEEEDEEKAKKAGVINELLKKELSELAATVKAMKEVGTFNQMQGKSIKDQIKTQIEANADEWADFKSAKQKGFSLVLDLKTPATMTVGGNTGSSAYLPYREITPGYIDLVRNRPFIEQFANSSGTTSPNIVWVEKTNQEGQAGMTPEGAVKPLVDFEWKSNQSTAKKVTDAIKVSTEMLDDIDFMAAAIENELRYQVDILVDEQLTTGAGTGDNLKGIAEYAGGYVLTTVKTKTPNNYDAIRAAIAQMVSLNFDPTHVFINPIDGANMDLTKDENGRPLAMEYKVNGSLFRLTPIETNQIAVGDVLVADMSKYTVRNYKPFAVSYGWENDDFRKNLVTVLGERRLHAYAADNHAGAFVYDTFANIKTAIAEVVEP